MRHRKKLLFATLLLIAAYGTWCFWPHSNPQAVRALTTLRDLVEQRKDVSQPAAGSAAETQIEVSVVVAKLNITDATTGLYCQADAESRFTCGFVSEESKLHDAVGKLCSLGVLDIVNRPQMILLSGQRGRMRSGGPVSIMPPAPAPAAVTSPPTLGMQIFLTELEICPEIRADGIIRLRVDCNLAWVGGRRAAATPKPIVKLATVNSQTTVVGHVKPGETLIIGGLAEKWDAPQTFRMPLLSDLPGVGQWFTFERERVIEEELVILATPRIVTSAIAK